MPLVPEHTTTPGSTCRLIPCSFFVYPILLLGIYNYKFGYPEKGTWYEPTGSACATQLVPPALQMGRVLQAAGICRNAVSSGRDGSAQVFDAQIVAHGIGIMLSKHDARATFSCMYVCYASWLIPGVSPQGSLHSCSEILIRVPL